MASNTEFVVMTINEGGARRAGKGRLGPINTDSDPLSRLISSIIEELDPEKSHPVVIAVQESHQVWEGENPYPSLDTSQMLSKALTNRLGTAEYHHDFSDYLDSDSHTHPNKWRGKKEKPRPHFKTFKRVKQGNAVIRNRDLAQWPWGLPSEDYPGHEIRKPISTQISRATLYSTGNRDTEPRNLIVVPLSFEQKTPGQKCSERKTSLYFMATHLTTLNGEDRHDSRNLKSQEASDIRLAQVHEILRIVDELREAEREANKGRKKEGKKELEPIPIILAGDFNARPGSPEVVALEQTFLRFPPRWHDGSIQHGLVWTHVGHKIHVDHIFYNDPSGSLTPVDCFALSPSQVGNITDHLPVIAKFEIQQEDAQRERR
jgi:hypothetical protein